MNRVSGPDEQDPQVIVVRRGGQTVHWLIALFLAVLVAVQVLRWDESGTVFAQNVARAGAAGVFAFSGQISPTTFGIFMVDVDAGTIWAYEIEKGARSARGMKLIAARSWFSDRYLEEYNCSKPTPKEIEQLVAEQRAKRNQGQGVVVPKAGGAEDTNP